MTPEEKQRVQTQQLSRTLARMRKLKEDIASLAITAKGKEARYIAKRCQQIVNQVVDGTEEVAFMIWGESFESVEKKHLQ